MSNIFNPRSHLKGVVSTSRRNFIKQSASITALAAGSIAVKPCSALAKQMLNQQTLSQNKITINPIRFNGERQDPITGHYHLDNGARMYNTCLMRFHTMDSMSPFGKGGINSYAYCLGDPINQRDPSGHVAISSLIIGATLGAILGAAMSAASEGISVAISGEQFDWKQVGIGAALGFIGGGFGAAARGASFTSKLGLAFAESLSTSYTEFAFNAATGAPVNEAAKDAAVGVIIDMAKFGFGKGLGALRNSMIQYGNTLNTDLKIPGIMMFEDTYKGQPRMNISGKGSFGTVSDSWGAQWNGEDISIVLRAYYDMDKYKTIRTISSHSGEGGDDAFGAVISRNFNVPVKSFVGDITASPIHNFSLRSNQKSQGKSMTELQKHISNNQPFRIMKKNPHHRFETHQEWKKFTYNPVYFGA